jgi:ParB family chromosome partitioning protein
MVKRKLKGVRMSAKKLADKAFGIGDDLVIRDRQDRGPRTAGGALMALREVIGDNQDEVNSLKEQLRIAEQNQTVKKVPINRLHKTPGRQRKLSPQAYSELKENLRVNPLDSPITITLRLDGDWDIVSGNNRTDIYGELGREEIDAIEKEYTPEEANRLAFYSNLMHPSLTAYEKYQGFKQRMLETGKDQSGISIESGLTKDAISRLMAFDRLPKEAMQLIQSNPMIKLGSSAVSEFAILAEQGRTTQVIEAIKAILEKGINQNAAVELANKPAKTSIEKAKKPEPNKIKNGKSVFAEIISVGKNIRISFSSEEDRVELEKEIDVTIRKFIDARKTKE